MGFVLFVHLEDTLSNQWMVLETALSPHPLAIICHVSIWLCFYVINPNNRYLSILCFPYIF